MAGNDVRRPPRTGRLQRERDPLDQYMADLWNSEFTYDGIPWRDLLSSSVIEPWWKRALKGTAHTLLPMDVQEAVLYGAGGAAGKLARPLLGKAGSAVKRRFGR